MKKIEKEEFFRVTNTLFQNAKLIREEYSDKTFQWFYKTADGYLHGYSASNELEEEYKEYNKTNQ